MAAILVFFCFHANWPIWPCSKLNILLNFTFESEAIRAILYGNKRILKWRPFWNQVYVTAYLADTLRSEIYTAYMHVKSGAYIMDLCTTYFVTVYPFRSTISTSSSSIQALLTINTSVAVFSRQTSLSDLKMILVFTGKIKRGESACHYNNKNSSYLGLMALL